MNYMQILSRLPTPPEQQAIWTTRETQAVRRTAIRTNETQATAAVLQTPVSAR